jgi:DNA-directed RNA polymerase specialized sigma24 family protein
MRRDQFDAAFRTLAPRVYAYARRHIDLAECKDVVAETFLIAWRRLGEVPEQPLPSPAEREALLLTAWDGLTYAEAAAVLGCSERALTVRIRRGRARLTQTPRSADHPHATAPSLRLVEDLP